MTKQNTLSREELDLFQQINELVEEKIKVKIQEEQLAGHTIINKDMLERECTDDVFHEVEMSLSGMMQYIDLFNEHLQKDHPDLYKELKYHVEKDMESLKKLSSFHEVIEYGKKHRIDPHLLDRVYKVSVNYCTAGNLDEAFLCFNWLCLVDSKNPRMWFMKGITEQNLKRYAEALCSYYQVISLDTDFINVYTQIMNCLILMGDLANAKEIYKTFTKQVDPKTYANDRTFCENMLWIKAIFS